MMVTGKRRAATVVKSMVDDDSRRVIELVKQKRRVGWVVWMLKNGLSAVVEAKKLSS